jgi:hypothetical protein
MRRPSGGGERNTTAIAGVRSTWGSKRWNSKAKMGAVERGQGMEVFYRWGNGNNRFGDITALHDNNKAKRIGIWP